MQKGFTLIELLVVVLIIGILAAVALPKYQLAVDKARYTTAIPVINAIAAAEERYWLANGTYTADMEALDVSLPEDFTWNPKQLAWCNGKFCVRVGESYTFAFFPGNYGSGGLPPEYFVGYQHEAFNGRKLCYAYHNHERWKKVCRSLGRPYSLDDSSWHLYLLD